MNIEGEFGEIVVSSGIVQNGLAYHPDHLSEFHESLE